MKQFPIDQLRKIKYLLTDIDNTVTQDGLLPATSLSAMEQLSNTGIAVVPITGRPAGWCDHIARMWPVDAVVGEKVSFIFHMTVKNNTCTSCLLKMKNNGSKTASNLRKSENGFFENFRGRSSENCKII